MLVSYSVGSWSMDARVKELFPSATRIIELKIKDTISDNPINTKVIKVFEKDRPLGYMRSLSTTTGCDSACLPLNYTTFYDKNGTFLALRSKEGLTKIGHAPFSTEDYSTIELLVTMDIPAFKKIKHPKQLTDALSGATLPQYKQLVVPGAAYSTLRIYLYNLNTISFIQQDIVKK
jgi:hypothetical protein